VLIDSGDGTANTSAPPGVSGWDNVGSCNGLNCVYLGYGWVLTAAHVGTGPATFGTRTYPDLPGSSVAIPNPGPTPATPADLLLFRIQPYPHDLPALAIPTTSALVGAAVRLIGRGLSRGAATQWQGIDGWSWDGAAPKRWGTNEIGAVLASGQPPTNATYL